MNFDHLPERTIEIELFNLVPNSRRIVEVDLAPGFDPGMEDCSHQIEEFWLVGLDDCGDHLAVKIGGGVIWDDQVLDLLESILGIEELAALSKMSSQVLIHQAQLLQQDACPVCSKASAAQAKVK